MSSTFSAESAASPSDLNGPECEPSRSARSTLSVGKSSLGTGLASPSIPTSESFQHSTSPQMDLGLTLFAGDSPAKTSASRVKARALKATDPDYGAITLGSLANFDPALSSWKTSQRCLVEGWETFSETWPRSGMMQNGTAYQLPPLVPLIDATESGLLPTPAASDFKGSPTGPALQKRQEMTRGVRLEEYLFRQQLPTPSAGSSHTVGRLDEWGGANPFRGTPVGKLHLSPLFVEEIMGFPIGHTACEPLETPSSRKSRKSSGEQS